jgi:transcription initiation factor TFIID subunit 15
MLYTKLALVATYAALVLADPALVEVRQNRGQAKGGNGGTGAKGVASSAVAVASGTAGKGAGAAAGGGADLTLDPAAVQTGSASTGQGGIGSDAGQASSATTDNNFINLCVGKTLTNGLQQIGGSCNGIRT